MEPFFVGHIRDQALTCHRQAKAAIDASETIDDATIHALRVQTKRLRAFWELLHRVVGKSQVKAATGELRKTASKFGAARDHHVMVKLMEKLVAKAKKPKLQIALAQALQAIGASAAPAVDSLPTRDEVLAVWQRDRDRWESLGQVDEGSRAQSDSQVRKGLKRLFKKARNLHQRAVSENAIEHWHDLRKWVKYLSLTIPLFGSDPATAIAAEEWVRLGKSLGKLHDFDELAKQIADLQPEAIEKSQADRAIRWIESKRDRLCVECDMHARRLLAHRPGVFAKMLVSGGESS